MRIITTGLLTLFTLVLTAFTNCPPDYCPGVEAYTSMEQALKEPEKVVKLDLSMLKLTAVPPEIGKLTNLECLDLSFNKFATLPPELVNCKKLKYIDLAGTHYMAKLPSFLTQLPNLQVINLTDHTYWQPKQFEDAKKLLPNVKIITQNE